MPKPGQPAGKLAHPALAERTMARARAALDSVPRELIEEPFIRRLNLDKEPAAERLLRRLLEGFESDPAGPHADVRLDCISALAAEMEPDQAGIVRDAITRIASAVIGIADAGLRYAAGGKAGKCFSEMLKVSEGKMREGVQAALVSLFALRFPAKAEQPQSDVIGTVHDQPQPAVPGTTETHNAVAAEETAEPPPGLRRTEMSRVESLPYTPQNITDLIRLLEDLSGVPRSERNITVANERLSKNFEQTLREHPDVMLPRARLNVHTAKGVVEYRFGGFFDDGHERKMTPIYVTLPDGDTRVSIAYLSGSQAAWRLLPDIDLSGIYDKGPLGEHAFTFPFEVQCVLDGLNMNNGKEHRVIKPHMIIMSLNGDYQQETVAAYLGKQDGLRQTYYFDAVKPGELPQAPAPLPPRHVPYIGTVMDVDYKGITKFMSELPDDHWPELDLRKIPLREAESPVYGRFIRAAVLSKNERLRYVFNVTCEGTFLAAIENPNGNINKYGLNQEQVVVSFPKDMLTPKCEYPEQIKEGMHAGKLMGDIYRKVEGFHDRVPLLKAASDFFGDYGTLKAKMHEAAHEDAPEAGREPESHDGPGPNRPVETTKRGYMPQWPPGDGPARETTQKIYPPQGLLDVEAEEELGQEIITAVTDPEEQQRMLDKTLLLATGLGDWEKVKDAVIAGAKVDAMDGDGWTALAHAAYSEKLDAMRFLMERGANVDARDKIGRTPLIHAARAEKAEAVALLLERKPDVDARSNFGETALGIAYAKKNQEIIGLLKKGGAKADAELLDGRLLRAAFSGDMNEVVGALEDGASPDARGDHGMTALMFAAGNNYVGIVRHLLSKGANPLLTNEFGETALDLATEDTRKEIMAFLKAEEGKRERAGKGGVAAAEKREDKTPDQARLDSELHIAVVMGFTSLVAEKLDRGAGIDSRDDFERTSLMQSITYDDMETFRLLLSRKPDIEARDVNGWTALKHAASEGRTEFVEALIAAGAKIDATDNYLRTPLMEAAYYGHKEAAKLLLDNGAKKDAKDRHKNIAYDHAVAQDHLDVAELIRAHPRAA